MRLFVKRPAGLWGLGVRVMVWRSSLWDPFLSDLEKRVGFGLEGATPKALKSPTHPQNLKRLKPKA